MADKETLNENDEKDDIVPVEVDTLDEAKQAEAAAATQQADDDDDDEDERMAESDDDKDDDAVNPNRLKRAKRRESRRAARERAERELAFLREQNEMLMRRVSAVEGNAISHNKMVIDQRLADAQREAQQAEAIIAKAVEAGNGEDVTVAMRLRDQAKAKVAQLQGIKSRVAETTAAQKAAPDPRVATYAKEWLAANPWYDPKGSDEDSAITNAIDNRLTAEGYNPSTIEYWEELTKRVAARINVSGGDEEPSQPSIKAAPSGRRGPPVGNSREYAPASTRKEVYVTPERKQAMIDAGVWEDPTLRNKYLKAYREYDKNSAR